MSAFIQESSHIGFQVDSGNSGVPIKVEIPPNSNTFYGSFVYCGNPGTYTGSKIAIFDRDPGRNPASLLEAIYVLCPLQPGAFKLPWQGSKVTQNVWIVPFYQGDEAFPEANLNFARMVTETHVPPGVFVTQTETQFTGGPININTPTGTLGPLGAENNQFLNTP